MSDTTPRLGLPLLAAAQAQKEMTHNEALVLADMAMQAVVESIGLTAPPATPALGRCWVVGTAPTGAWSGHAGAIAGWTAGGWRFVAPFEGLAVWSIGDRRIARRTTTAWVTGSSVVAPTGGSVIDTESRVAITAVLSVLRLHGLIE